MRARVARVAVLAVLVALLLVAVPLAVVIGFSMFADERSELQRAALAAAVNVGPDFTAGDPVELPHAAPELTIGVYDLRLNRRAGEGPDSGDATVRRALSGVVAQGNVSGQLVATVPVSSSERVIGVVRAASPATATWRRVAVAWLALLAVAGVALGAAVAVARRQAGILSAPLEALSRSARAVADGDLSARAQRSAIVEIDHVASTQNLMLERLTLALERERQFSANASHQLRTPLTGLQLSLEAAMNGSDADLRHTLRRALSSAAELQQTIDAVLQLARLRPGQGMPAAPESVDDILQGVRARWHANLAGAGRRLELSCEPQTGTRTLPGRPTAQILDALLENALEHGRGTVTVSVRDMGEAVAVDVSDEGATGSDAESLFERGLTTGPGHGIGLSLARSMAESVGGRLNRSGGEPTTYTLLLP